MTALRNAFLTQSEITGSMGSPFTQQLLRVVAERLEPGDKVADRLFAWQGELTAAGDAVALRLAGALHGLVLDGTSPELAAAYPPNTVTDDALWAAISKALIHHEARIDAWLDRAPQTNEVGRSAVLIAAGHWLADRFGLPLVLSELGASAGLNLMWDRYALEVAGQSFGATDPALTLCPDWKSDVLPIANQPQVTARRGTDLGPLSPQDPDQAMRLQAYVWPDQAERMTRCKAAISVAEAKVDQMDAAAWLEARLAERHQGVCHMLYHTVAWQYFPKDVKARATELIEAASAQATDNAPLSWFSMEADGRSPGAGLTMRVWPGDLRFDMGRADFHARWVDWRPMEAK